ncbi:MAG: hypothetical protein GY820_30460 [Gammaproteobacteria bacterium]|nr:hypothetical protein [Gammaproteobacteria bacterium]
MKDHSEVCSFSGRAFSPYPHDYSTAFAFSEIPYPPACRLTLRLGFRICGDSRAYHVPHKYLKSDLGSTHRPTAQHLRRKKRQLPNLAAYRFGSGLSAPLACLISRSCSDSHMLAISLNPRSRPHRCSQSPLPLTIQRPSSDEATFVPTHFIQRVGYEWQNIRLHHENIKCNKYLCNFVSHNITISGGGGFAGTFN